MGGIRKLKDKLIDHLALPWPKNVSEAEKMVVCVYDPSYERDIRYLMTEIELGIQKLGKDCRRVDLTNIFQDWLAGHKYAEDYFLEPEYLLESDEAFLDFASTRIQDEISASNSETDTVILLYGVGGIYPHARTREILERVRTKQQRIVVFFPGSKHDNTYRLLNAYEGWDYHYYALSAE